MSTREPVSASTFITHASDVASFYGFRPVLEAQRAASKHAADSAARAAMRVHGSHTFTTSLAAAAASMPAHPGEPVLSFYATPNPSHMPSSFSPKDTGEFGLHVVGSPESLGEVLLIKTLFAILTEWGVKSPRIRLNALGDRDSKVRFERELTTYLRKHSHALDASCRENITQSPCATYNCESEVCREILADGPRAMNFLSEKSRSHFREVLEHVERLGFPYELDDLLVGDDREPRIVFAVDLPEGDSVVMGGAGGRYDEMLRRMVGKKDAASVSASIFFNKKGANRSNFAAPAPVRQPKVYFVQLGLRAKLQGLAVVDMLRQAQVPVSQSFDAKSLGPQLASARQMGVSHLLIMGQREALDGTVILRSATDSSQTVLQLTALPRVLRTLR